LLSLASDSDGSSSSVDAIMKVVNTRKAQLQRQQQSVSEANQEAETVNLLALTKPKENKPKEQWA
jgi:hypothetical protein